MLKMLLKTSHRGAMGIQGIRVTSCGNTLQASQGKKAVV